MINHTPIAHLISPIPPTTSVGPETREYVSNRQAIESSPLIEVVEHKADSEVEAYINPRKDVVEIPPDVKSLGVESVGVPTFPSDQSISLPLSDEAVMTGLKAPFSSSFRWLAEFCKYLLKRAHMSLKEVHGKIIRIGGESKKPV